MKKVVIIGYGRSGKDTAALWLHQNTRLHYVGSTSWLALPIMARHLHLPEQVAWETRHQNREAWKIHLANLKVGNPLLLVRMGEERGATLITGLRDLDEVQAAKDAGYHVLWIDAQGRGIGSDITVDPGMRELAHEEIDNHKDVTCFTNRLLFWAENNGVLIPGP